MKRDKSVEMLNEKKKQRGKKKNTQSGLQMNSTLQSRVQMQASEVI